MAQYICEGYIHELRIEDKGDVKFSLIPTEGFAVRMVNENGTRKILFLSQDASKPDTAFLVDVDTMFSMSGVDRGTLLSLKVNRLKVRLVIDDPVSSGKISAIHVL